MSFTIGADPEMFTRDSSTGELIPCISILGGTKEAPIPVKNGAVQEDNVMAEFNIDVAETEKDFIHNILSVRQQIRNTLKKFNLEEHIVGSVHFPEHMLMHPQALVFGCEPDFNAWTGEMNQRPYCEDKTLRTAGGHIHVGSPLAIKRREATIQFMDLWIGVPSIIFDTDSERRKLYGKAGAFRPKSYGVEYRTVSNFWIKSPETIRWVYRQVKEVVARLGYEDSLSLEDAALIQRAINTSDKSLSAYLIDHFNIKLGGLA